MAVQAHCEGRKRKKKKTLAKLRTAKKKSLHTFKLSEGAKRDMFV